MSRIVNAMMVVGTLAAGLTLTLAFSTIAQSDKLEGNLDNHKAGYACNDAGPADPRPNPDPMKVAHEQVDPNKPSYACNDAGPADPRPNPDPMRVFAA